ncbi:MAG: nucleoside hydrolase, partial [Clostridia bacterium]|nr:nucleoside hydrolase [Clostridia bacterium]
MKRNIIIDTDPGVDDAIAIMYAIMCEEFDIKLLTSAGGNGPIENITANALHLTELFHVDIPVAEGAKAPLCRPAKYATGAQGKSGFGGYEYNRKKLKKKAVEGEACDVMYETLKSLPGKTSIVSIGPMTNIAKMLQKHPGCKKYIKEIIFESGTKEKIYGRPYKSFNVGYDPEAAEVVFNSGVKLVMVPMELGHFAYLDKKDIKRFKKTNKIGKIYAKMFKKYKDFHVGHLGAAVHDVCTIYYLTHPEYIRSEPAHIELKYYSDESTNFGYIDTNFNQTPNATICVDLDINMFKMDLFEA